MLADIGVPQNAYALGIGRHDTIFDPVMNHLDEMAGTGPATMEIAHFGGAARSFTSRRADDFSYARRQRLEDRIEMPHGSLRPTDHHAIAAFQPPDAAAGANVDIMNPFLFEHGGAADVID